VTSPAVRALVARGIPRAAIAANAADLLPSMRAWGAEWASLAAELGIPCPAELVELGGAMEETYVCFDGWEMLTPARARETRAFLETFAEQFPVVAARAAMLPIFVRDGDLVLLAASGEVWPFMHEDFENDTVLAPTFEAALAALASLGDRPARPG
jgi:hypothetical protein